MANARISGKAKVAGVMGWPVSHSLSPRLHNYWLSQLGIDGAYIPLAVEPEHFKEVMIALPKMGLVGINLTLPHKELVLPLLASMDDNAHLAGMANTVVVMPDGKLHGMNTDSYGFIENIHLCLPLKKDRAVVLGAGGAAKAACYALVNAGFEQIIVTNRSQPRADELAKQFNGKVVVQPWEKRSAILEGIDLLVNATSLGMTGKEPLELDLALLNAHALVTDMVYTPLVTPLIEKARANGNQAVDGLGMLLHQAVPAFEAWFGVRPEVTVELRQYMLSS